MEGTILDCVQSAHYAADCVQHAGLCGNFVVCESRTTQFSHMVWRDRSTTTLTELKLYVFLEYVLTEPIIRCDTLYQDIT